MNVSLLYLFPSKLVCKESKSHSHSSCFECDGRLDQDVVALSIKVLALIPFVNVCHISCALAVFSVERRTLHQFVRADVAMRFGTLNLAHSIVFHSFFVLILLRFGHGLVDFGALIVLVYRDLNIFRAWGLISLYCLGTWIYEWVHRMTVCMAIGKTLRHMFPFHWVTHILALLMTHFVAWKVIWSQNLTFHESFAKNRGLNINEWVFEHIFSLILSCFLFKLTHAAESSIDIT